MSSIQFNLGLFYIGKAPYRACRNNLMSCDAGHGDQGLFSKLHVPVVQGLPREQVEWRRWVTWQVTILFFVALNELPIYKLKKVT